MPTKLETTKLRCTTREKRDWDSAAKEAGMSLSSWIRTTLNGAANQKVWRSDKPPLVATNATVIEVPPTQVFDLTTFKPDFK